MYVYILTLISASKTENTLKTLKKRNCTKKMIEKKKVTTDLSVFFQMFQKFSKDVCMIKSMTF